MLMGHAQGVPDVRLGEGKTAQAISGKSDRNQQFALDWSG